MEETDLLERAERLWNYHKMDRPGHQPWEPADLILGLGSYDLQVAERCAEICLQGGAPQIVFSGAEGNFTRGKWPKSEAAMFADRAMKMGVEASQIWIEKQATHTGDNIRLTRELCRQRGLRVNSLILVAKPNMMRRGKSTVELFWPEVSRVHFAYPDTHFYHNPPEGRSLRDMICELVGDFQRIVEYPAKGYQSKQTWPEEVMQAYQELAAAGYRDHMM